MLRASAYSSQTTSFRRVERDVVEFYLCDRVGLRRPRPQLLRPMRRTRTRRHRRFATTIRVAGPAPTRVAPRAPTSGPRVLISGCVRSANSAGVMAVQVRVRPNGGRRRGVNRFVVTDEAREVGACRSGELQSGQGAESAQVGCRASVNPAVSVIPGTRRLAGNDGYCEVW